MVAALLAAGPAAWAADPQSAAVMALQASAAQGDREAAFAVGLAYDLGQGVASDPLEACRWYTSAAEAGHVTAMFNAAVMRDSGRCGARQAGDAATWYARAAAAGSARAQFALGQLYAAGDGVPRNPAQSVAWYRAAAAGGITAAQNRLAPVQPDRGPAPQAWQPAAPTSPENDRRLPAGTAHPITLVWTAPPEPGPARFFVEVQSESPTPQDIVGHYVELSALQITLPPIVARYSWRVLTVGATAPHYAVGPWRAFETAAP